MRVVETTSIQRGAFILFGFGASLLLKPISELFSIQNELMQLVSPM